MLTILFNGSGGGSPQTATPAAAITTVVAVAASVALGGVQATGVAASTWTGLDPATTQGGVQVSGLAASPWTGLDPAPALGDVQAGGIATALWSAVGPSALALRAFTFNVGSAGLGDGTVDWLNDTVKLMLVGQTYVPDRDQADLTTAAAAEISTGGYVAGFAGTGRRTLANRTITSDGDIGRTVFDADDPTPWTLDPGDTLAGLVIYRHAVDDAGSTPLFYKPLPPTPTTGVMHGIAFSSQGVGYLDLNQDEFMQATITLTDAQIKTLPTSWFQIVSAPGSGRMILPVLTTWVADTTAGAYTNLQANSGGNAFGSSVYLAWDAPGSFNDASAPVQSQGFLDQGGRVVSFTGHISGNLSQVGISSSTPPMCEVGGGGNVAAGYENAALYVVGQNDNPSNLGNFTGGNSANTLKVTVVYTIVPV